jgi:hypothetical protein
MATDIAGLFGLTPEGLSQQRYQQDLKRGYELAQLSRGDAARATLQSGVGQLGRGIAGLLGVEDPQMQQISQQAQLLRSIDMTDPKSIIQGAQLATQMGNAQLAAGLIDRAKSLQESSTKIALQQAQTIKALQPNKLTGDERYRADLLTVEQKLLEGKEPTQLELSAANMAGQILAKPRSFNDPTSGQLITVPGTDPSKAFPLTYKAMGKLGSEAGTTMPKATVQQATEGNIPSASQQDIGEIDASLVKLENSKPQLKSLSDSLRSGDVKFNAAANAFDFLGAVVPPVFGGQEVGNQVKKDEFTRAITERVNFVLNNAKGVQAKDDAQRAKDQIATPSTFYSSARMQGAIDSLIRAEASLEEELKTRKSTLQNQGKPKVAPTAKKSETETVEKPTAKSTQTSGSMTREQMIDAVIQFNADKGRTVTRSQAEKALRDAKKL